jgi:DNA-binding IscR family transcriptional regulator
MMLSVSRRTDLGLKALRILAREPRVWTAAALAAAVPTTPAILNPALAAFVRAGWLVSGSGPSGGYLYRTATTPPSPPGPGSREVISGQPTAGSAARWS